MGTVGNEIAAAFVKSQGLEEDRALEIHRMLAEHPDIEASALEWARSGVFPDHPVINGKAPIDLALDLRPTQVFTLLVAIRRRPEAVEDWLTRDRKGLRNWGRNEGEDLSVEDTPGKDSKNQDPG